MTALTSLPTELIEHIASYLDFPSTRSLRLTTRSLTNPLSRIFKVRFFHTHTVTWTEQSLNTLLEISLHSQYGPALHHLRIDATPQHSIRLWQIREELAHISIGLSRGAVETPRQRDLRQQWDLVQKQSQENSTFFKESRFDQKTLKRVFENLASHGSLSEITFLYKGMDPMSYGSTRGYCIDSQCEMSRPFVSTMAALASSFSSSSSSHVRLSSITMDRTHSHGAIAIGRLESIAPFLAAFDQAFDSLAHLALNLRDWRRSEDGFRPFDSTRPPFVVRFLAKARNLQTLRLSCYSMSESNVFDSIAEHCRFEKLTLCDLSVMSIPSTETLAAFLEPSNESLGTLCLKQMQISDFGPTWAEWLASLASAPQDENGNHTVFPRLLHISCANLVQEDMGELRVERRSKFSFGQDWRARMSEAMQSATTRPWYSPWGIGDMNYPFLSLAF